VGWRWIFFVNLPVGANRARRAMVLVPDLRPGRRHRLDLAGLILATVAACRSSPDRGRAVPLGTVGGLVTISRDSSRRRAAADRLPGPPGAAPGPGAAAAVRGVQGPQLHGDDAGALRDGFAILGLYLPLTIYYSRAGPEAVAAG